MLEGAVANRLRQVLEEGADENDWEIIALSIEPDHVRLLPRTLPAPQSLHHKKSQAGASLFGCLLRFASNAIHRRNLRIRVVC